MSGYPGVHAPYNFVPFSNRILCPYSSEEELPCHDRLNADLRSGEIFMTMKAETPVFISDGKDHFFRAANGKFTIPGSTIRGMTRENMQILGFGLIRPGEDLEDRQIYFREMAAAGQSVHGDLRKYYWEVLKIQSNKNAVTGLPVTTPQAVSSGYLHCSGGKYYILPTVTPCLRVSRQMPDLEQFGAKDARTISVAYQESGEKVKRIVPLTDEIPSGMKKGKLLYTGKPIGRNPKKFNCRYLFPEEDITADPIPVSDWDILSYRIDFEGRKNTLGESRDFWALPKEGTSKPVFFLRYDGHLYFGMSRFLRVGYKYPLSEGLPQKQREKSQQENRAIDYPHAILGFAEKDRSYRSRVSFGDFAALGKPKEESPIHAILVVPKPSYYPSYLLEGKNYNDIAPHSESDRDRFQLRGYKQYWLKEVQSTSVPEGKEKVGTVLRPLPVGTVFQGVIRFRNLTDAELGLLLWSLRLETDCFQTIGMAKPYGYGRMSVNIDKIRMLDLEQLYGEELTAKPWRDETDQIDQYIETYRCTVLGTTGKKKKPLLIKDQSEIKDFFFLKRSVRDGTQASYMELSDYKNVIGILPAVRQFRTDEAP